MTNIKYNDVPFGHHSIRAEVILTDACDKYDVLFNKMKQFVGYVHILINGEHTVINQQAAQLIPCRNYNEAQAWTYKLSVPQQMI
jgi:hypothetical protein